MTRRKSKRAFEKWWKFQPISQKEWLAVIDFCVEKFGSLSRPSMLREHARIEARRKVMNRVMTSMYQQWVREIIGAGTPLPTIQVKWISPPRPHIS